MLYEKLMEYSESDTYPFHMPGHKRQGQEDAEKLPYELDITEIDGFDDLHHPQGILKESQEMAAEIYGTKKSYYLVNGSTSGIMIAISALVQPGEKILIADNCHRSVWNTVYVRGLQGVLLKTTQWGAGGNVVEPGAVEKALNEDPLIRAVIITSPTYEGVVSPVKEISRVVHAHCGALIVDEAHGAHLPFVDKAASREDLSYNGITFPKSALYEGADVVIQSLHKTLPALTQTAMLHVCTGLPDIHEVNRFYSIYLSSSPSYILLASIDHCIQYMSRDGLGQMAWYGRRLQKFWEKAGEWEQLWFLYYKGLKLQETSDNKNQQINVRMDPSKIVFGVKKGMSGSKLMQWLREEFHLEFEMCQQDYVIAMTSLMDTEEGFLRLENALEQINGRLRTSFSRAYTEDQKKKANKISEFQLPDEKAGFCSKRKEILQEKRTEWILLSESQGRRLASPVGVYPPGISAWYPGEIVTGAMIDKMENWLKDGFRIDGLQQDEGEYKIEVLE